ncbi:hypothetical protein B0H14DRAFT_2587194 [Mycena olivaceomarginata]|nr:hypothetical protein B0H14DRAFT_2587194 [Mycena olivaceomarginata]
MDAEVEQKRRTRIVCGFCLRADWPVLCMYGPSNLPQEAAGDRARKREQEQNYHVPEGIDSASESGDDVEAGAGVDVQQRGWGGRYRVRRGDGVAAARWVLALGVPMSTSPRTSYPNAHAATGYCHGVPHRDDAQWAQQPLVNCLVLHGDSTLGVMSGCRLKFR